MLECEILRSMIEYPEFVDEFLARSSRKVFSKKGNALLDKILPLAKNQTISLSALKASLPSAWLDDEFVLEVFSSTAHLGYLDFIEIFLREYEIACQKALAKKMLFASENGEVLMLSALP